MSNINILPHARGQIVTPLTRSFRHRGIWTNALAYVSGDIVTRNGSSWLCVTAHEGQTPNPNAAVWGLLAQGGDGAGGGGASALVDLTDVDLTGLTDGQLLVWNSALATWTPLTLDTTTINAATVAALDTETQARTGADNALDTRLDSIEAADLAPRSFVTFMTQSLATVVSTELNGKAPIIHGHPVAEITNSTAVGRSVVTAADAAAARSAIGAVANDDGRLSNARTPTAHEHTAAQISDATATGRALVTAANAAAARAAIGAVANDDSLLSNARTPTAHKATHATGGSDALVPADIGAATAAALATEVSDRTIADAAINTSLTGKAPTAHEHTAAQISDATATGRALVTAVDAAAARTTIGAAVAGSAVPVAGATGQMLAKTSATDYATSWVDAPAALPTGGSDGDVLRKSTGATSIWETIATLAGRVVTALGGVLSLSGAASSTRGINLQTGGVDRWSDVVSGTEAGANAGGDRSRRRFADNGTLLGTIWSEIRSTGQAIFNGIELLLQTGNLRVTAGDATVTAGNVIVTAGRAEFGANSAEVRFGNGSSSNNSINFRHGTSSLGVRLMPNGIGGRSLSQGDTFFYDDGQLSGFYTGAAVSITPGVMGSPFAVLSGSGGSSSIAFNNPTLAPLGGNAIHGRLSITVENRGSGACATPTFGTQYETRAWGAALGSNQIRYAEFRFINAAIGTKRYFQTTDWITVTP